ncbi:hypothetical protein ACFSC4_27735 [Deinococcus malanensis]|uniref:hypothetical protein n=1 Tax=Deinococcus malanensis TaxID=1706855 RepID=UPI00362C805F
MFSVVDMYDTLTSAQPDQPAWTPEAASEELRVQGGRQFDPQVVQAFLTLPFWGQPGRTRQSHSGPDRGGLG